MKSIYMYHLQALLLFILAQVLAQDGSIPIDDYVSAPEPDYAWVKYGEGRTPLGGQAHYLNVTSLRWLDTSKAYGPSGDLWSHRVTVIVPKVLKYTNVSVSYLTGSCNDEEPNSLPPIADAPDMLAGDEFAHLSGVIAIVVE